jgi:AcrR family transcriptional regulator
MARSVPADRIEKLVDCAAEVFIEQGYRRTQMEDVAGAVGIAKGTLYLYVDSKEALFDLVARFADGPWPLPNPLKLPIPTPRAGATARYIRERLSQHQVPEALTSALAARRVVEVRAELDAITTELYDTLAANRRGIKLLDRSARDLPELAALWSEGARGGLIQALRRYLDDRVRRGLLRAFPDTGVAARLTIETLVFWAVHRHWDPQPPTVDETTAKDTVIEFIVSAFAKR